MTAQRVGGYYDLVCPLVIGSGIFGPYSKETGWRSIISSSTVG